MAVSTLIYNAYRDYSTKRSALLEDPVFHGEGVPIGQREAVLLIPGFGSGDWTFSTMSRWLQQIGYRTYVSGINLNVGCPQRKVERMLGRLEEISKDEGGRIVIVGHSLGGLVGCALARKRPDLVRHVIAVGSPLRDGWQAVSPEVRPALFAIHSFFQKFIEAPQGCGTERCTCDFSEESRGTRLPTSVISSWASSGCEASGSESSMATPSSSSRRSMPRSSPWSKTRRGWGPPRTRSTT